MPTKKRRNQTPPRDPPTVARVRSARAKLWREGGGTLQGLIELSRSIAAGYGKRPTPAKKIRKAA